MVDLDLQGFFGISNFLRNLLHLSQVIKMDREIVLFLVTSIEAIIVVFAFYYFLKWLYLNKRRKV